MNKYMIYININYMVMSTRGLNINAVREIVGQ